MVYTGSSDGVGNGDPVLAGLIHECVHKDLCQCHSVGSRYQGWHHPEALCSNIVSRRHQSFERRCGYSHVQWPFPVGCNQKPKNVEIAVKLFRIAMHVLTDILPSVPQRGQALVSAFRFGKLKPTWECERFNNLQMRRARRVGGDESSWGDSGEDEWGAL